MNILLPTDFSENAELASAFALDLARRSDGRLVVFHAYDIPHYERSLTTSLLMEMKRSAEDNMKEFEEKHLRNSGVPYETHVKVGNPIRLSRELAKQKKIGLVVMGTRGASGIEEFLIGSNAASVIHNVHVPVMVIPPHSQVKPLKKIVLASDLELEEKEQPLREFNAIARIYGAEINILHFQDKDGTTRGNRDFINRILGDTPHTYSITSSEDKDLDETILDHCKAKNADAVAAITKRYGFFQGLFHKSLTSQLAYHTTIPMIALHEPK